MDQYFIGVNQRSEEIVMGLLNLGATLMFYYHWKTIELNEKYGFWDGEWFLLTDVGDDFNNVNNFLYNMSEKIPNFKYEIEHFQRINK